MKTLTILVVDDDPGVRGLFERILQQAGHDVVSAADGCEALAAMTLRHFDLVVTDVLMPKMDGVGLIEELKRRQSDTRILAVSGGGLVPGVYYVDLVRHLGAHATIVKPFSHGELFQAMDAALGIQPAASG